MSVATRLVGAIWLAALAVIGGFTYLQAITVTADASFGGPRCSERD